jgi:WD40 repeat protein
MKCLEKDRNRRYETASGLARDIQRYLNDEPVQACPPSAWYRFGKFARRNRAALTAAAALLLIVIAGLSVSNWLIGRQRDAALRSARERTLELFNAKLAEARANRLSRREGQRFRTLEVLGEAVRLAQELNLPPEHFTELRNEAIASLALTDLRIDHWEEWADGGGVVDLDNTLERYAQMNSSGEVSIRRLADNAEVARLPGRGIDAWTLLSRDGRFAAVASATNGVQVWSLAGGQPRSVVEDSVGASGTEFSPDSRLFAVGQRDGMVRLYELATGKLRCRASPAMPSQNPESDRMAFHPNKPRLAVSRGTVVEIYDVETGKIATTLAVKVVADFLSWHPDGKTLAVVGADRLIRLWDVDAAQPILVLDGPRNHGIFISFNHAGDLLAAASWDGMLRLWDCRNGQQIFRTQSGWAGVPRFGPDDRLLGPVLRNGKLGVGEFAANRAYRTLVRASPATLSAAIIDGRGRWLLAVGTAGGLELRDPASGVSLAAITALPGTPSVAFDPSGALLTNGRAGLWRWPIRASAAAANQLHIGPPQRLADARPDLEVACSSDGSVVARAQFHGGVALRPDRPDQPAPLGPHDDVRFVAVHPEGRWAATGSHGQSREVKIWQAEDGQLVTSLHAGGAARLAFSPDGRWLATSGDAIRVWKAGTWEERAHWPAEFLPALVFSPDSRLLAFETGFGAVRLVDPATGRECARLEDPDQIRATNLCFSPDGTQLLFSSGDSQSIHVWDLRLIREELDKMGLDWDLPAYLPRLVREPTPPLQVKVELGELDSKKSKATRAQP